MINNKKILQIIPSNNVFALYTDGDSIFKLKIHLFALIKDGNETEVRGMVIDEFGISDAEDDKNFIGYDDGINQFYV